MDKIKMKKLSLNTQTIRVLDSADLEKIAGGISGSFCGNPTCCQDCHPNSTSSCNISQSTCSCWGGCD